MVWIVDTLWENNTNFVQDVPTIYVNSTVIVIIDSEKKQESVSFVPPFELLSQRSKSSMRAQR